MPLRLYLVRHGETEWSKSGRHTGRTDIALTAQGEQQAQGLATMLHNVTFSHVFSSPLQRARQTRGMAGLGDAQRLEPDLAEWDYGGYEGLRSAEIHQRQPDWSIFRDGAPGGETPVQVADRADALITGLRQLDGDVALFSHGHFGAALAMRWIGLPLVEARHFPLSTASVSVLADHPRHPGVAILASWNAVAADSADSPFFAGPGDPAARRRAIERWENEGGEMPPADRSP